MNEQELEVLFKELRLSKTGIGWTLPGEDNRRDVELFIRKHFSECAIQKTLQEKKIEIGILNAKIFVYEAIILKSNFSPMLNDTPQAE